MGRNSHEHHHHRRSIRLKDYDYTQPGAYFVTLCTEGRVCLFGEVVADDVELSLYGRVVSSYWSRIPCHFPHVTLGAWVVMPNHIHGIIVINDNTVSCRGEAILVRPGETEGGGGFRIVHCYG